MYLPPVAIRLSFILWFLLSLAACRPNHSDTVSSTTPASSLASTVTSDAEPIAKTPISHKVALVFQGAMADQKAYAADALKGVTLKVLEHIGPDQIEPQLRELAQTGHHIIVATDPSFSQASLKVAQEFPKAVFEQAGTYRGAANVSTYSARTYEAAYLAGIIAAGSSKSFRIGVIADTPSAEHLRNINAFALGAQTQLPQIRIRVGWGKSVSEIKTALNTLLSDDVDVILPLSAQNQVAELTTKRHIATISWLNQMPANQQNPPLAEVSINWAPYLANTLKAYQENHWEARQIWWGAQEGVISVQHLSPQVSPKLVQLVNAKMNELQNGTLHPFTGPIIDKNGVHLAAKGAVVSDSLLKSMSSYVPSVRGHPPTH